MAANGHLREQYITLETLDDFRVYGVLNSQMPTQKLIVFVHGLTGEKENHLYYNGARFFPANGFDTFRYDLFSNELGGRKLANSSLTLFSQDLSLILEHFYSRYDEIHVVGHSIGGCVAMNANPSRLASLILWDTGLQNDSTDFGPFVYHDELGAYLAQLKISYLLSVELISERAQQGAATVKKIQCPVKLIFAGNTAINETWKSNLRHITSPYELVTISGAGHGFNELGKNELLFEETLVWVQKCMTHYLPCPDQRLVSRDSKEP